MMKALLLTLGLAAGTLAASAQTYGYLTLRQADGTEQSLAVDGLKITFANGNLTATNAQATATIALSDMSKMYFATEPTAIAAVTAGSTPSVSISGGRLQVNAPAGASVSVYTLDGRAVPHEGLTRGVYLVRVNGLTYKVVAR